MPPSVRSRLAAEGVLIQIGVLAGDGVGPEVMAEAPRGPRGRRPARRSRIRAGAVRPGRRAVPADRRGPARRRDRPSARLRRHPAGCRRPSRGRRRESWRREFCSGFGSTSSSTSTCGRSSSIPGVEGPIRGKGPDDVDMVVVRENNEDLYVGAGGFTRKGTPEEVAIQTSINTRAGVERTIRYAFDLARRRALAGPFRGPFRRRARAGLRAAGDPGGQDERPDLRPRPLDACLHRGRRAITPRSRATISTWTPAACGWWRTPSGST